ncbi:MAG TPA: SwmB domain-containing protein [Pseudonocardiaceae bacterium]|nr:SwmB domain-containing protein [Pseudonocardiaceae bacterium]
MQLGRQLAMLAVMAVAGTALTLISAGTASAAAVTPIAPPPPMLIGAEAHAGTHDVQLVFDQELMTSSAGLPGLSRFVVTVNGVARNVTALKVTDDVTAGEGLVDLTLSGLPLASGGTVTVTYRKPLSGTVPPPLVGVNGVPVNSFGPVSILVS